MEPVQQRFNPQPVVLENAFARLEPLNRAHAQGLLPAGQDPNVWSYLPRPAFRNLADVEEWIDACRREVDAGQAVVFAIVDAASGNVAGSTRYLDIRVEDRGLEIGWTWIAPAFQRTAVNTACKLLLLQHAFENLGAIRVQLKTDGRNLASQRAIERLGALREGVLRRQRRMWDGHLRDTVYYSILENEWPAVKQRLQTRLHS